MTSTENLQRITEVVPPAIRAALERVIANLHDDAERRARDSAIQMLRDARLVGQSLSCNHPLNVACDNLQRLMEVTLASQYFSKALDVITRAAQ